MNNNNNNRKELVFLRTYAFLTVLALIAFAIYAFNYSQTTKFNTIDVERINVVEKNGDLKMVISNSESQHSGIINGKPLPQRQRPAGMIFFNSKGDECGGLIYDAMDQEAGLILSVDQFKDDQIMQLQYYEKPEQKKRKYGLQLWDFPKENTWDARMEGLKKIKNMKSQKEKSAAYKQMDADSLFSRERLFVGKRLNNDFGMFINDDSGKPRIKIYIDKNNTPKLEFLDDKGKVLSQK